MKKWLLLFGAIAAEVTGSLSLRAAQDNAGWYALVVVGYVSAFVFLAGVLRTGMSLGVAYGIWGAMGVALTALLAALIFAEPLTVPMLAGMALIIAGVLLVELGSQHANAKEQKA